MTGVHKDFGEVVELICKEDKRYKVSAYFFIRNALDFTIKSKCKKSKTTLRSEHVSGHELIYGIRDFALDQYGPITKIVLDEWGIRRSEDFGEIVFNLVDYGIFGKTGEDSKEDFKINFSFDEAFVNPFLPVSCLEKKEIKAEGKAPVKKRKKNSKPPTDSTDTESDAVNPS